MIKEISDLKFGDRIRLAALVTTIGQEHRTFSSSAVFERNLTPTAYQDKNLILSLLSCGAIVPEFGTDNEPQLINYAPNERINQFSLNVPVTDSLLHELLRPEPCNKNREQADESLEELIAAYLQSECMRFIATTLSDYKIAFLTTKTEPPNQLRLMIKQVAPLQSFMLLWRAIKSISSARINNLYILGGDASVYNSITNTALTFLSGHYYDTKKIRPFIRGARFEETALEIVINDALSICNKSDVWNLGQHMTNELYLRSKVISEERKHLIIAKDEIESISWKDK